MKKILPFSFIVIAALILAACSGSAQVQTESPALADFYSVSPEMGAAPPVSQDSALLPPGEPGARAAVEQAAAGNSSGVAATSV